MPWSKFKVLLPVGGRTNQATSKFLGTKFKSIYLHVEGRTKSLTSVLVEIKVLLTMGGRMNQATSKCLGTKFKSLYLQAEGQTKSLTSVLVEI